MRPWNTFIEGDNLDVLPTLAAEFGNVDLVYIDPPYNTGNDFAYRDDIRGKPGTSRHEAWVAMMRPRLAAARELLDDAGAIFVSIDDNEAAYLRLLMDELFGEPNFLAQVVVNLNPKGRQLGRGFATSHEYLLVYAKDARQTRLDASSADAVLESDFPLESTRPAGDTGTCRCATPTRSSTRSPRAPCTSRCTATRRAGWSGRRRSRAATRSSRSSATASRRCGAGAGR